MGWIFEHGEKLGGLATVGTLVVALCALVFASIQIRETRDSQREATAKGIYGDYLKLAFDNPKYSNPTKFLNVANGGWKDQGEWMQDERYRWFVAIMLNSCDEISSSNPGDTIWQKAILEDLKLHEDYLKSSGFKVEEGGWTLFSPELNKIASGLQNGPKTHKMRSSL